MDLTRPVVYRTVNINTLAIPTPNDPLDGYVVNDVRFAPVEGVGFREKRSLADGYDYGRVFLGRRQVQLRGTIYAQSKAALHDRIRVIRALFTPTLAYADNPVEKGFLPFDFDWMTTDAADFPGGIIPVRLYVRPDEQPGTFFPRDAAGFPREGISGLSDRGYSEVYEASLEARDPRFYARSITAVNCTTTEGNGTVVNKGDYAAPLQVQMVLNAGQPGPRTVTLTIAGTHMTITIPNGPHTRTVRVDGNLKVCTLFTGGVETLRMDLVDFAAGQTWAEVQPGSSLYDWTSTGGGRNTPSQFWFTAAFA